MLEIDCIKLIFGYVYISPYTIPKTGWPIRNCLSIQRSESEMFVTDTEY